MSHRSLTIYLKMSWSLTVWKTLEATIKDNFTSPLISMLWTQAITSSASHFRHNLPKALALNLNTWLITCGRLRTVSFSCTPSVHWPSSYQNGLQLEPRMRIFRIFWWCWRCLSIRVPSFCHISRSLSKTTWASFSDALGSRFLFDALGYSWR